MGQGNQLFTVKLTAADEENRIYILATAAIDTASGRCISQDIVASNSSTIMNISIHSTHKDFLNKIQNIVYTGKQLKNITKALQEQFRKSFSSDGFIEELIHYIETRDIAKLGYVFEQAFITACGMGNYNVQVATDQISESDLNKTSIAISMDSMADGSPNPEGEGVTPIVSDVPPGAKVVKFKFLLSPVTGIPVASLYPGSGIVVKLDPSDPKTLDTIQSLNLRSEDGTIKPMTGVVYKITHNGTQSDIIVKLNENLYGRYLEEENTVKVKTTLSDNRSRIQPNITPVDYNKNLESLRNDNTLFYYILGIAGLVALGVLIIIFLA